MFPGPKRGRKPLSEEEKAKRAAEKEAAKAARPRKKPGPKPGTKRKLPKKGEQTKIPAPVTVQVSAKKPKKKAMPAAKAKKPKGGVPVKAKEQEREGSGRPTSYKPEYVQIARKMCSMGANDADLADAFNVTVSTIWRWSTANPEFCSALKIDKGEYDERVKRSLAQRALGYSYDAVKIFMPAGAEQPVYAKYREHVPPDPGAAKIWLANRQPDEWRERREITINPHEDWLARISIMENVGAI